MNTLAPSLRYGSVCSGIEAATVAWQSLGMTPAWFSEIDPFAIAVLAHHYPQVLNAGDMTRLASRVSAGELDAPDILVGGTPCQAFSVAGLRRGLSDPRGALTLKYAELANAIDQTRKDKKEAPAIIVWENVPGILGDRSNAFGCFLGAISGEGRELRPPGQKWTHAGCVYGPQRSIAWRVLDAQHFGLAQRRKRVFVVASGRADFDSCSVLFEPGGMRRDSSTSAQAREGFTSSAASGAARSGDPLPFEEPCGQGVQATLSACFGGGNTRGPVDSAACLMAHGPRYDFEVETFAVHALAGDLSHTLNTAHSVTEDGNGRGIPVISVRGECRFEVQTLAGPVSHTLNSANNGKGASEDGTGRGVPIIAVRFQHKDGTWRSIDTPASLAFAENSRGELRFEGGDGRRTGAVSIGGGKPGQGTPTVLSVALRGRAGGCVPEVGGDVASALRASGGGGDKQHLLHPSLDVHLHCSQRLDDAGRCGHWPQWRVRRLMPVECERLQGFPDGYTLVPYRGKPSADGPRYRAIGNSMAVPVVTWIGQRLIAALGKSR